MNTKDILRAMRADEIPKGRSGLWTVAKWSICQPLDVPRGEGRTVHIEAGSYTNLHRLTLATMHQGALGELVMHDEPHELRKHLEFILRAHGRVLKTGLGLGCVVRGLLANPRVTHVTVIEKEQDVLNLVAPFMPNDRVTIIKANALHWCKCSKQTFDCAWHDIWEDESRGRPHLQISHGKLLAAMKDKVRMQGAWALPRHFRRLCRKDAHCL